MIVYALLGFAIIMAASFLRRTPDKYGDFCIAAAVPNFLILPLPAIGAVTGWVRPITMDGAFRHADVALGLDGFAFTRWLVHHGWYKAVGPIYDALPLVLALGWSLERSRVLLRASVIGPLLAFPLYLLFPAAGPQYAFAGFPNSDTAVMAVSWMHPRNCFPSMHLAWAMLVAINVRDQRWRWAFALFAILTSLVAVAGGEHYFVDMIAAVPFAFAVQRVAVAFPSLQAIGERLGRSEPLGPGNWVQAAQETAETPSRSESKGRVDSR